MGSLAMWLVATQNFATVDRVLTAPTEQAAPVLGSLPRDTARPVLRHLASELNRWYFLIWFLVQLVLAAPLVVVLQRGALRTEAILAGVMITIVVLLAALVMPQIVSLGRSLDFVPRNPPPPQMSTFWMLHAAYTGLDGVKLILGCVLAWRLAKK